MAVNTSGRGLGPIFLIAVLGGVLPVTAQVKESAKPDHRIVLRVSSSMLNSMMDDQNDVDRETDVREVILGTTVVGRSKVTGKSVVKLIESGDRAKFEVVVHGTAVSNNTGYNGPVIVTSRSVTKFMATQLVVFEPTRGFYGQPPKVTARTQHTVNSISSTRGGLIGRIIRRRATRIEASQHALVEQIASQRAARRIQLAFEKTSAQRLAKLNQLADVRSLASATGHSLKPADTQYTCCTTPHYFQIATSFSDSGPPGDYLPKYDPKNPSNAPIEVWVHDSLIGEPIASSIDTLAEQAGTNKLAVTVSAAARVLISPAITEQIPAVIGRQTLHVHKVGKWRVARLEIPAPELAQVVQVLRPMIDSGGITVASPGKDTPARRAVAGAVTNGNRVWTSGKYTALARFVALEGDTVKLRRSTGVNTQIAFEKLSPADRTWIKQYLANAPRTAAK